MEDVCLYIYIYICMYMYLYNGRLKMYGKYQDYDILDMQMVINELVKQFISQNQDYEDQEDFTGRVTKKIKF